MGQNEAGKSNLFEALYTLNPIIPGAEYSLDEDWPVDRWEGRKEANGKLVCKAQFVLSREEIEELASAALVTPKVEQGEEAPQVPPLSGSFSGATMALRPASRCTTSPKEPWTRIRPSLGPK